MDTQVYKGGGGGATLPMIIPAYLVRDICRTSLYHCFLALREPFTMQIAQYLFEALTKACAYIMAVNSERCESLGLLTRTGFSAEVQLEYNSENKTLSVSRGSK